MLVMMEMNDGNTTNDPTEVIIAPSKVIEVTKRATVSDNGDGVMEQEIQLIML